MLLLRGKSILCSAKHIWMLIIWFHLGLYWYIPYSLQNFLVISNRRFYIYIYMYIKDRFLGIVSLIYYTFVEHLNDTALACEIWFALKLWTRWFIEIREKILFHIQNSYSSLASRGSIFLTAYNGKFLLYLIIKVFFNVKQCFMFVKCAWGKGKTLSKSLKALL